MSWCFVCFYYCSLFGSATHPLHLPSGSAACGLPQKVSLKLCADCKGFCGACAGLLCVMAYVCVVLGLLFLSVRM